MCRGSKINMHRSRQQASGGDHHSAGRFPVLAVNDNTLSVKMNRWRIGFFGIFLCPGQTGQGGFELELLVVPVPIILWSRKGGRNSVEHAPNGLFLMLGNSHNSTDYNHVNILQCQIPAITNFMSFWQLPKIASPYTDTLDSLSLCFPVYAWYACAQ